MFVLRMPKILRQIVVLLFMLWFLYVAYNEFKGGNYTRSIMFSMVTIFVIYRLIKEIISTYKKGQLFAKEVVFDEYIWGMLKNSLSLSYLALLINLIISVYFTEASSYVVLKDLLLFSVYFSLFVFVVAQIFQFIIHYSKE